MAGTFIIYPQNARSFNRMPKDVDPNEKWANHFYNARYLTNIVKSSRDFNLKAMAGEELTVAERKMLWWSRRSGFDINTAGAMAARLKKLPLVENNA
jgi:hypothetical protein